MYKIGVVGQRDRVMCFMAAGFSVYSAENAGEASKMLTAAKNDGCAVIYIVPDLAGEIAEDIKKYAGVPLAGGRRRLRNHTAERCCGACRRRRYNFQ